MRGEGILFRGGLGLSKRTLWTTTSRVVLAGRFAAVALAGTLALPSGAARAQDATWTGSVSGDLSNPANWVGGAVPTGTAYFGASGNTALSSSIDGIVIMQGWTFGAGAPVYSYNVTLPAALFFDGVGIVNNSSSIVTLNNDFVLTFSRGATAANAIINNSDHGDVTFQGGSTADRATINNLTSTATVSFDNNSGLGNAIINNSGTLGIGSSSAENAYIFNNHIVHFYGTGTGGNATIQNVGGVVNFDGSSTGGNAAIVNSAGAVVDFSGSSGPNNDHKLSVGAIIGDGSVYLGSNALSIGGANQNITLSSVFSDCGASGNDCQNAGASGGALVKVGTGTLTIASTNTYTGGTTVSAGKLQIGNTTTAGSIVGDVTVGNGTTFSAVNGNLNGIHHIDNSGVTEFHNNTNPFNALITNYVGGVVDFSGSAGPAGDGKLSVAEIAGAGNFYLGGNTLTLNSGFNTTVSGIISDCGVGGTACGTPGATGGALVKSASGQLTLTGANTYTGGTTVNAGLLALGDATAKGSIIGGVTIGASGNLQLVNTDLSAVTTLDNAGLVSFKNNTSARDVTLNNSGGGIAAFSDASSAGNATITNSAKLFFNGTSTAGNATITNTVGGVVDFSASTGPNGDHKLSAGSIAGAGDFYLGSNMLAVGGNNQNTAVSGTISDCGAGGTACSASGATGGMLIKTGTGDLTLSGVNSYGGGTWVAAGTLSLANNSALGAGAVMLDPNTTLHLAGVQIANTVNVWGDPNIAVTGVNALNSIVGSGDVNILGTSGNAATDMLTLNGPNAYTAATFIGDGTAGAAATLKGGGANALSASSTTTVTANSILDLNGFDQAIGALAGAGTVGNSGASAATLTANGNNSSTVFSGVIENGNAATALTKTGIGSLTLSGTSTFTGATTVNGGRLIVDGSIVSSSGIQVNAGGSVGGSGFLPSTIIASGGALTPGTTTPLTVNGNLTFDTGAIYAVQSSPTATGRTDITGTASLAGTAYVSFSPGNYTKGNYTILSAAGGLGGSTFGAMQTSMPGFVTSLGYTANDAVLTISSAALGVGQRLGRNQQNVANTINDYFNNGGMLPTSFSDIFSLSGSRLGDALSLVSGEAATGAQQGAFQLMNGFFGVMLDPAMGGAGHVGGQALGFATERDMSPDVARAYASVFKSAIKGPQSFESRWTTWVSGFGGSSKTGGDMISGSHDSTARIYGSAGGADYHISPETTVGFAFAGAGTSWGLAGGLGGGKSDAFQAGFYGSRRSGNAYVSAAVAFANHWMSTDRYALAGDHLTGQFDAQSYGGRVEGGYRFATALGGVTPYAAAQAQVFHAPGYHETDLTGGGLAVSYGSRNATDTRSEFGVRYDHTTVLDSHALLTLRGRLAWAHDWVSDPTLTTVFQSLPGSSFVVGGATPAKDTLLASAGAELLLTPAWSVLARFDTELSGNSQTYAGTGTVRYTW